MAHRVLAEHHRQAGFDERLGEAAGARRRDHRVVGAVLEQHRHVARRSEVDAEQARRHERAHGQHARGTGSVRRSEPERQGQPATLREAADDGLGAVEAVLRARGVEEVVDRGEGAGEFLGDRLGLLRREVEPREPGRRGDGAAGQHRRERAVRVEVAEQAAEVALVGAVPVQQQQQTVGVAAGDDVGDQVHRGLAFDRVAAAGEDGVRTCS